MRRAIDWLGDKGEARRYAAALILRELAENAPAVFNVHVRAFIDAIWSGLRDPKQLVREASVAALRVRHTTHPAFSGTRVLRCCLQCCAHGSLSYAARLAQQKCAPRVCAQYGRLLIDV